jgi:cellulose synthase/poly-beta-1,6-N-acetylglucosamine synthase-like glycosyltransferase
MMTLHGFLICILFALLLVYLFWVLHKMIAWHVYGRTPKPRGNADAPTVTVIVPVRNEAKNIKAILDDLSNQNYPDGKLEILISDDHSDDDTASVVASYLTTSTKNILWVPSMQHQPTGKKAALTKAIDLSKNEIILTTDADCRIGKEWVGSMASAFSSADINMVTGFVVTGNQHALLSRLEQLDQLVLSAVGAVSLITGRPLLCSGANIGFRKKAFMDLGGYSYGAKDASGDDTYLMLCMSPAVRFNKDPDAVVSTQSHPHLKDLIQQRIRWGSKVKNYNEKRILYFGVFMAVLNLLPILISVLCIAGYLGLTIALLWLMMKFVADLLFVSSFVGFANQPRVFWMVPVYFVLYPFYTLAAAFLIPMRGYEWKGRAYNG